MRCETIGPAARTYAKSGRFRGGRGGRRKARETNSAGLRCTTGGIQSWLRTCRSEAAAWRGTPERDGHRQPHGHTHTLCVRCGQTPSLPIYLGLPVRVVPRLEISSTSYPNANGKTTQLQLVFVHVHTYLACCRQRMEKNRGRKTLALCGHRRCQEGINYKLMLVSVRAYHPHQCSATSIWRLKFASLWL